MLKPLFQKLLALTVLIIVSNTFGQNLDIENVFINTSEKYSEESITIGPNVTIGASGMVTINTNTVSVKPQFTIVSGGQLYVIAGTVTGIIQENDVAITPYDFKIAQNFPNPFNPSTTIAYTLAKAEQVKIVVYNISGQLVKTLLSAFQNSGNHTVTWDATDSSGKKVSSGVYFYQLEAGPLNEVKKMTLIK